MFLFGFLVNLTFFCFSVLLVWLFFLVLALFILDLHIFKFLLLVELVYILLVLILSIVSVEFLKPTAQIYSLFLLSVAACETAVGLALIIKLVSTTNSINFDFLSTIHS